MKACTSETGCCPWCQTRYPGLMSLRIDLDEPWQDVMRRYQLSDYPLDGMTEVECISEDDEGNEVTTMVKRWNFPIWFRNAVVASL